MSQQYSNNESVAIAERAFTDLLDGHDLELIPELYADDCAFYGMGGPEAIDADGYEAFLATYFEAFPDLSFEIDEIVADGDRVAVRWTSRGTHDGDLQGIPATGTPATVMGSSFMRIEGGEIVEVHSSQDMLGLLQQIGAAPSS